MIRKKILCVSCILLMMCMTGCGEKYNEKDIIGKNSDEIVSTYGIFDNVLGIDVPDEDGVYRNCSCGYILEKPSKGFFGSSEEILLYIKFDENGKAVECDKRARPGG